MIIVALLSIAQANEDVAIKATTVIDGKIVTDAKVPPPQTGVTIDPVIETPERTARRDVTEIRVKRRFRRLRQPLLAVTTTTSTGTVVSQTQGMAETACTQIGVVGNRAGCRPPKKRLDP